MNSSYKSKIDFGEILSTITFLKKPKHIVEIGILEGYSLSKFIDSSSKQTRIDAYDIFEKFKKVAAFESLLTGSEVEMNLINGVYPRLPIEALVGIVNRNLQYYGPPEFTNEERQFARRLQEEYKKEHPGFVAPAALHETIEAPIKTPKPAANDNGDVSWIVPMSSISGSSRGMDLPSHNWQSTAAAGMGIGHKVMILMTKTLTGAAVDLMTNSAELKAVRDEFEEKTRGFVYKPYIPEQPPLEFYRERNKTFGP